MSFVAQRHSYNAQQLILLYGATFHYWLVASAVPGLFTSMLQKVWFCYICSTKDHKYICWKQVKKGETSKWKSDIQGCIKKQENKLRYRYTQQCVCVPLPYNVQSMCLGMQRRTRIPIFAPFAQFLRIEVYTIYKLLPGCGCVPSFSTIPIYPF